MSDIELYLLEVDKDKQEARNIAVQSGQKLRNRQLKLIDLIKSLEEYINNKEDAAVRAKTLSYLADVLENIPSKVLSGQDRRLLCDFVLGRIQGDLAGIGSSARILIALEEQGKWDPETAQKVTNTFIDHANPLKEFKLQTDRYAIVRLFDILLSKYRMALKEIHDSDAGFMPKFISFFEGEKDPRNLMMIFSLLQVPMTEWDIRANAQSLFEAVFNYFPVTFKPPPDDPYGITAQDLKDRLRDCIASNSEFAAYSIPALLDKLDSTAINTKRDVLQALQACISSYAPNTLNLYSVALWDTLKFEILNVQEEELAAASLQALSLLAARFAKLEGPLNAYLRPVIKECNEHLEDAPTKQSQSAGRILHAVAASALPVADMISRRSLPTILSLYRASDSLPKRRGLLEAFNGIIKAYVELASSQTDISVDALQETALEGLDPMLVGVQKAPKSEVSYRLTALEGLTQLLAVPRLLSQDQTEQVVDTVTKIILHESVHGHGDIRSEAIKALSNMAHSSSAAIRDRAIPAFMAELPDNPGDGYEFAPVLEALAQLGVEQKVFDTVVRRLKNKLNAARHQDAAQAYQRALLLAILYTFSYGSPILDEDGVLKSSYWAEYAEPLISDLQNNAAEMDTQASEIIGRICNLILRSQGVHFQNTVHNKYLEWAATAQSGVAEGYQRLAPFWLYYHAALRAEVLEPEEVTSLLRSEAALALQAASASTDTFVVLRHLSLLINKFINPKAMETSLRSANIEVETLLSTNPSPESISLAFTIVKALLIQGRSPALTTKYLQALLHLLSTTHEDKTIPRRFTTLLAEDDILTKQNHCVISGLYKQKTFNQIVPSITEAVRSADAAVKPNYLIALSGILRWLPYSMLESSLPTMIAPLLQTLDLSDPAGQDAKAPALAIFESVLMHAPDLVAEHAASLITRLLNGTVRPANAPNVRAKSLQCLALVPRQLKREVVVPYRRQVVKKLMPCLDDPKRDVRAEAVRCRKAWMGLDEEEEG